MIRSKNLCAGLVIGFAVLPAASARARGGGGGPGSPFCFGDGSSGPCPCAPPDVVPAPSGAPGHGCANPQNPNGALLTVTGTALLGPGDTVQFHCLISSTVPITPFSVLIKGDAVNNGVPMNDGILCITRPPGTIVRFGGHMAGSNGDLPGEWTYPNAVQTMPVSVRTAQNAGTAFYQLWYRSTDAGFCNPSLSNYSNGMAVTWQ